MLASADYSFDIGRIFVGEHPVQFYIEVLLRSSLMFIFALLVIRFLGKRNLSQISAFDLVIIIALGSAVGDPMFYDDVPILPALTAVSVVVVFNLALARLTRVHRRFESFVESSPRLVVRRGAILHDALKKEVLSIAELLELLRIAGVERLEDVEAAVLETSGHLSVLRTGSETSSANVWIDVGGIAGPADG